MSNFHYIPAISKFVSSPRPQSISSALSVGADSCAVLAGNRLPSPQFRQKPTPQVPVEYTKPMKCINSKVDVEFFLASEGLARFMDFVIAINKSVSGCRVSSIPEPSKIVKALVGLLETLDKFIDEIPPAENPQRFGNQSFRAWISRVESNANTLLRSYIYEIFPELAESLLELESYFVTSFGNGTRLDYGSGHEINFVAFLSCLDVMGCFNGEDYVQLGLRVFRKYLGLVRRLQRVYNLEPAGSHGVYGLDDFFFIAYIWGSSQLVNHPHMKPKAILDDEVVVAYSAEFIFLDCIKYVKQMKTGPFHEHSPMLFDISSVPLWKKVNGGLVKMFIAEVLEKVPIVQHFEFGNLLPWSPVKQ
eukprot:Partr_v1_DN27498_c1_g1_i1_m71741 putative PPIases accelerate the folding of proteins. It catalyzes the cis-trans isomerization of proline imidic peptide bonds in oligopeptides. Acts as a regulatory subunit for PP2A-like phosphatases modulating their activity or substrate specificity, probably by inducing a conformational change in the catalytic subunit, a direct target of the PPIase. Can reactivate inactive phosphatase PP2A-phosphatase methylesterase complexes (PP2Ai) in presence of ATP and Mg(2